MTERSGALQEDPLYMSYCQIVAKSCGEEEEEEEEEPPADAEEAEEREKSRIHVSEFGCFGDVTRCTNNFQLT